MKFCPICDRNYEDKAEVCEIDRATLQVSGIKHDSLIDKVIKGRYRVLKKLGEGGMGAVYLADQFAINRKVALKILHPDYARDEDFIRRFRQEATLAASFSHHNVITVFDFDQADDGSLYIVMEFVDGRSLSEVIQNNPMAVGTALDLAIQIAEGLSAAHHAGIIHRDIKPDNIMIVGGGKAIKLMDFGIARLRDTAAATRLTQTGMIMGTPAYIAPEQIEGGEPSERTDIYAFGIVIYEMLTGRVPFSASTPGAVLIKHLHESPIPLSKVRKEIPSSVERIVVQALQKNPEKRLRSMDEVVEALKKAHREVEQQHSVRVNNLIAPQISLVRQKLAAVASPFRRFLGTASADRVAPKRNEATNLDDYQSVSDAHNGPPETSLSLTTPGKNNDIAAPTYRESQDVPRIDPSEISERLEKPESQVTDQSSYWGDKAPDAEDVATMSTSPAMETIAETVAFTQPIQVQEHLLEGREAFEEYSKAAETSIGQETPAAAIEDNNTTFDTSSASSHIDNSSVAAGLPQPKTQIIDRLSQPERHVTVAGELTATGPSLSSETIAETATFTQPIEKVTSQRKSWLVAAVASVIIILLSFLGGAKLLRYLNYFSSVPPTTIAPPDGQERIALPGTKSESFSDEKIEKVEDKSQSTPPIAAPEMPAKDLPIPKFSQAKKGDTIALKPIDKSPSPPVTVTTKKPESALTKPVESKEQVRVSRPDLETKSSSGVIAVPEGAKKPDAASKKKPEPPQEAIASIKPPEVLPPLPRAPRIELTELSIVTNKRELRVKERIALTVKGKYSDGKESNIGSGVQWKSSDTSVVSINSKGELEALKEGKAQITATLDGVASSANTTINVKGREESVKTEESGEQKTDIREKNRRILR